jgi:hypothetical protein
VLFSAKELKRYASYFGVVRVVVIEFLACGVASAARDVLAVCRNCRKPTIWVIAQDDYHASDFLNKNPSLAKILAPNVDDKQVAFFRPRSRRRIILRKQVLGVPL